MKSFFALSVLCSSSLFLAAGCTAETTFENEATLESKLEGDADWDAASARVRELQAALDEAEALLAAADAKSVVKAPAPGSVISAPTSAGRSTSGVRVAIAAAPPPSRFLRFVEEVAALKPGPLLSAAMTGLRNVPVAALASIDHALAIVGLAVADVNRAVAAPMRGAIEAVKDLGPRNLNKLSEAQVNGYIHDLNKFATNPAEVERIVAELNRLSSGARRGQLDPLIPAARDGERALRGLTDLQERLNRARRGGAR